MQKDDSKGQARTAADSEQNDQDLSVSQHNAKPPVVGIQCHGTFLENVTFSDAFFKSVNGQVLPPGFVQKIKISTNADRTTSAGTEAK